MKNKQPHKSKGHPNFYVKKQSGSSQTILPIYLQVNRGYRKLVWYPNELVDINLWDRKLQRVCGEDRKAKYLNELLDSLENLCLKLYHNEVQIFKSKNWVGKIKKGLDQELSELKSRALEWRNDADNQIDSDTESAAELMSRVMVKGMKDFVQLHEISTRSIPPVISIWFKEREHVINWPFIDYLPRPYDWIDVAPLIAKSKGPQMTFVQRVNYYPSINKITIVVEEVVK